MKEKCTCKGAKEIMYCEKDCPGWCGDEVLSEIHFTPGVPTEDGWYVVKSQRNEYTFYETIIISSGMCITGYDGEILSHAKLPEL